MTARTGGPRPIIDPLEGPTLALGGRVATMDPKRTTLKDGVVYLSRGNIVAVQERQTAPPAEFANVPVTPTGGVIYPGLIELHNHIAYNALPMWQVPETFTDRNVWAGRPEKRRLVTAPMAILAQTPNLLPAVARYVELKCLLSGTTTTQGFRLNNAGGAVRYYRGLVRNVEQTEDPELPNAGGSIPDVDPRDAEAFLHKLERASCYFLHLSEGTDKPSRQHFLDLEMADHTWALTDALAGIHATALHPEDLRILARHKASVVWSPLSNYLLYSATMDLKAALRAGLRIGLGSDWSVSGSKNLMGELKVARLVSQRLGAGLTARDLVAMATCDAAAILRWDKVLGSIEPLKRADLVVIRDPGGRDYYEPLLRALETDILLVLINGVPRYGLNSLMGKCRASDGEALRVGGRDRLVYLGQKTVDPAVGRISANAARETLTGALGDLPGLARKVDRKPPSAIEADPERWHLALDEMAFENLSASPATRTVPPQRIRSALGLEAVSLESLVSPIDLDPPTVADDSGFFDALERQKNLPRFLKRGIPKAYA